MGCPICRTLRRIRARRTGIATDWAGPSSRRNSEKLTEKMKSGGAGDRTLHLELVDPWRRPAELPSFLIYYETQSFEISYPTDLTPLPRNLKHWIEIVRVSRKCSRIEQLFGFQKNVRTFQKMLPFSKNCSDFQKLFAFPYFFQFQKMCAFLNILCRFKKCSVWVLRKV